MSDWANYMRGLSVAEANYKNNRTPYRMPKTIRVFTIPYAILGVDGQVLFIRHYPPMAPKDIKANVMQPIPPGIKVKPGWAYRNGNWFAPMEDL